MKPASRRFYQTKYEEFLSSCSKNPKARQYHKVSSGTHSQVSSEIPSDATDKKSVTADHIARNTRINVSHGTRVVGITDIQPVHARTIPQLQVTGGSQQPVRRNRNAERQQRRRTCQLQAQEAGTIICPADIEARLRPVSLLSCVRHTKSTYGDQNAKPNRLAFLRLHFPNAMFDSARAMLLLRDTRLVPLQPNTELRKSACLNHR